MDRFVLKAVECTVAWGICNVRFNSIPFDLVVACVPFSLHLALAENKTSLPARYAATLC